MELSENNMFINLENLKIARKNAGYATLEATKKVCGPIKSNRVEQWEAGELSPTWSQLKKLSDAYQINVFLLTSKEKLRRDRLIADYRKKEIGGDLELNAKKIHPLFIATSGISSTNYERRRHTQKCTQWYR